ncbi:MAG: nucleotidyltransferase domain-containing protein [Catenulispora sp.]
MNQPWPDGGSELSAAEIAALDDRWAACWTPVEVARRLAGVATPWYVAAGWALDLFRGGAQTRKHGDVEIAIPAADFPEVRDRFPGYVFDAVGDGQIWENAAPDALAATHQTWIRDPHTGGYLLDVFREPHDGQTWICRHDDALRLPYSEIILRTPDGIPFLAPELVLLFKAKHVRAKDQRDFDETVPHLTPVQRRRLAELVARVYPEHRWLSRL